MSSIRLKSLSIPLSSLNEGVSSFSFETAIPDLKVGDGCSFPDRVDVTARVTKMNDDFFIEIKAASNGHFICDRCNESFQTLIEGELKAVYTFDSDKAAGGGEDECHLLQASDQEIDVTQDVLDTLVLAVPAKHLCSEACAGLCSTCGSNLNDGSCDCEAEKTDPRWDTLKDLKF